MRLDHQIAFSICGKIIIGDPQNVWSLSIQLRNVWKQNDWSTKRPSTKCPAMKRPDQLDHLHYKCDKKTFNFTSFSKRIWQMRLDDLSAYAMCA
jgi:hypothetical protein